MSKQIRKLVKEELSGENAKVYVEQITRFHRIQASTMFREAAEHVKRQLNAIGLQDARIEQFKSDGATKYWTHTPPPGWEVKSAEIKLVEPEEKTLARYSDIPTSLHTYSNGTPPEGITAELVDVGKGTRPEDYEGKDVKNKIVLATGRAMRVHEQAVYKRGAAGVLTDTPIELKNVRESVDIPDAHAYQGIWPTADELDKVKFGFSLSKRQGDHLRVLLKEKKSVRLQAKVDAKLFSSNLDVVTATIQGSSNPNEEIFLIAHLCHPQPSANDNASGSGLLIEIARTIQTLIKSERLLRPKRTIRFIWVPETSGTIALLHNHQDWISRFVAGINLDMVGEDQEVCKSTLRLDRTPDSLPSYLNDLLSTLIEDSIREFGYQTDSGLSSPFRFTSEAHTGGSDHHEFVDATIGIPCVMLFQWPDMYYHTSMDTIDKVSVDSLKRVGWITAVAALTLANGESEEAILLATQTCTRGISRIEQTQLEAVQALYESKDDPQFKGDKKAMASAMAKIARLYRDKLEHTILREKKAVHSVKRLAKDEELNDLIEKLTEDLETAGKRALSRAEEAYAHVLKTNGVSLPVEVGETATEKEAKNIVPVRLFKGTLPTDAFRQLLGDDEYKWYEEIVERDREFGSKRAEILNFMDGIRDVQEIVKAVSAEYSETSTEDSLKFIRDLEKTGLVSIQGWRRFTQSTDCSTKSLHEFLP